MNADKLIQIDINALTFMASKGDGTRSTMSTGGQGSRITIRVR